MAISAWRPILRRQPQIAQNFKLLWRISIPTFLICLFYAVWLWAELQALALDAYDAVDTAIMNFEDVDSGVEAVIRAAIAFAYTEAWIDMALLIVALIFPIVAVIYIVNWVVRFLARMAWENGRARSLWAMNIAVTMLLTVAIIISLLPYGRDGGLQQYVGFIVLIALSVAVLVVELLRKSGSSSDA